MILISHRGNTNGPNPEMENRPDYINAAANEGYDVEVDVWLINSTWMSGHDGPCYEIGEDLLLTSGLWCHAKNIAALERLNVLGAHVFWHQEDDVTLTSRGFLWTYPGKYLTPHSICVMPERANYETIDCAGVCTDFIKRYES
tara:strand:- start:837 stop:1265 length:429 start_codon:yes stop_codon:yes gene_type:complete